MRAESTQHYAGGWISDGPSKEPQSVSSEPRAAAHATLRVTTRGPGSRIHTSFGNVAADDAQELRELRARAVNFLPRGIACPPLVSATRDSLSESGDVYGWHVKYNPVSGRICAWTQSDLKSE